MPDSHHLAPFVGELIPGHRTGLVLQGLAVRGGTVGLIHLAQQMGIGGGHQPNLLQAFQNADIVGVAQQRWMLRRPRQSGVLHHKFNIDDTSGVLLEVERRRRLERIGAGTGRRSPGAQVIAHLGAHLADLLAQLRQVPLTPQHLGADVLERVAHILAAHQHPSADQGLMLPGPGFILLIALKRSQ